MWVRRSMWGNAPEGGEAWADAFRNRPQILGCNLSRSPDPESITKHISQNSSRNKNIAVQEKVRTEVPSNPANPRSGLAIASLMAYDPSVGIAPRGPTPMSTPSNVGGGSGAGGGLASLSSFSAVAAAPLGSSSAASAAPPPPTSDKIIKEVMHKITQIVVRARLPSHLDVRTHTTTAGRPRSSPKGEEPRNSTAQPRTKRTTPREHWRSSVAPI